MSKLDRRCFIETLSRGALAAVASGQALTNPVLASEAATSSSSASRRLKYVGWEVGVTYQATEPGGLSRDDMMRLLDAMARHRMNLLSLQMLGFGHFDPQHDGYCWPVANPKLRPLWDSAAINGRPETEFVREAIRSAADRGIEVQLFMNWGIWNPEKVRQTYPDAGLLERRPQPDRPPATRPWFYCGDAPGTWRLGIDEVTDLLTYYSDSNVTSYGFENLCSHDCFCPATRDKYHAETGKSLLEASTDERNAWSKERISVLLKRYVDHIRSIRPNLDVWLHTSCTDDQGHDAKRLRACGINYLLPHTFHFPTTKDQFYRSMERMEPNQCVLHFSARDIRPTNYPLWIQTPESIAEKVGWVLDYAGKNLAGVLFYNPNAMSPRNVRAVYEQIRRFEW
ncbi:MAG TPA: hypothetical protein DD670_08445 [Planctomycetaceae bacterium]|nr:hypothetical protein [Planctomycetaceae bacterium]